MESLEKHTVRSQSNARSCRIFPFYLTSFQRPNSEHRPRNAPVRSNSSSRQRLPLVISPSMCNQSEQHPQSHPFPDSSRDRNALAQNCSGNLRSSQDLYQRSDVRTTWASWGLAILSWWSLESRSKHREETVGFVPLAESYRQIRTHSFEHLRGGWATSDRHQNQWCTANHFGLDWLIELHCCQQRVWGWGWCLTNIARRYFSSGLTEKIRIAGWEGEVRTRDSGGGQPSILDFFLGELCSRRDRYCYVLPVHYSIGRSQARGLQQVYWHAGWAVQGTKINSGYSSDFSFQVVMWDSLQRCSSISLSEIDLVLEYASVTSGRRVLHNWKSAVLMNSSCRYCLHMKGELSEITSSFSLCVRMSQLTCLNMIFSMSTAHLLMMNRKADRGDLYN